jgi:hypothetical protein
MEGKPGIAYSFLETRCRMSYDFTTCKLLKPT